LGIWLAVTALWLPAGAAAPHQAPVFPTGATVTANANLRAGPGTANARTGGAKAGETIMVVGCNTPCTWYKLPNGAWISASLVRLNTAAPAVKTSVPEGAVAAQVTGITDGDTITVKMGGKQYKVRYILMNTPETDEPFGDEATAANRALVMGKTVYLLKDVSETDRYGRLLRYVYLPDGLFVNAELVRAGWAQVATFPPDIAKEAEIRAAQQEAMNAGRGLWADGEDAAGSAPGRSAAIPLPAPTAAAPAADPAFAPDPAPAATPAPQIGTAVALAIVAVDKRAEYVDIRNSGSAAVDLGGWVLQSEKGNQTCPLGGSIAPGQTLRIYAMTGEGGFNCGFGDNIWNNSDPDAAVLWSPQGNEVSRY
jgi:endonuclease YncB( thermonuclease family)